MKNSRFLIVSLSGIGNFLMQSPVFELVKKVHPESHIVCWVAPRGTKVLAENNEYIDEVIEAPIQQTITQHFQMIRKLRKRKFEVGIVLSPGQLIKSAAYLYMSRIPMRIGNTYPWRNNERNQFLLTHAINELPHVHDIEQNLALLAPLGISAPTLPKQAYKLDIPSRNVGLAEDYINSIRSSGKLYIGLHAGSAPNFTWKRWPLERFAVVAAHAITTNNAHILLFGGPDELEQNETLQKLIVDKGANKQLVSIVSSDLLTTAAIMQKCRLIISNDSGLMHLAAASEVPVIGLFGPTDERLTGPRGRASSVVRAAGTEPEYITEQNYNFGTEPHKSMLAITPEMVMEKMTHISTDSGFQAKPE